MRILIVEGNSSEIIKAVGEAGQKLAFEKYREALAMYAPEAGFDVSAPYAPELDSWSDLTEYDAFALTGSGVSWSSSDPEAEPYLDHLRKIFACNKPVIGSCWGMQTVAQILGGHSEPNPKGTEIGLAEDISLTQEGRRNYIFDGLPNVFPSPCIHRDHVTKMPKGFELLASNGVSDIQAIASTRPDIDYVGFQFHPELDLDYISKIIERRGGFPAIDNPIASFPEHEPELTADPHLRTRVFANWINHVRKTKTATNEVAA